MQAEERYLIEDGFRIHTKLEIPEGKEEKCPLVILVHGFTGHMEERHILAAKEAFLEVGFAVLRAEMYGHGQTDGAFRDHTLYKWVTNMLTVVDYAKCLPFVTELYLSGHSQGGLLTMLIAGMERDLFKAILPLSPAVMIPEMARKGELLGLSFDPDHVPDLLRSWDGRELNGNYVRVAQTIEVEPAIRRYEGPVLLIHGDADEAVPYACSVEAQKQYQQATLVTIPGDTHCYDHHLELVTEAIKAFMKQF